MDQLKEQKHHYRRKAEKYQQELKIIKSKKQLDDPIIRSSLRSLAQNIQRMGDVLLKIYEKTVDKKTAASVVPDAKARETKFARMLSGTLNPLDAVRKEIFA